MTSVRTIGALALGVLLAVASTADAQAAPDARIKVSKSEMTPKNELPLKYTGTPTMPQISAADLMTRLYIFADDSMMGREVGTEYNLKGTAYIEAEARRLGLVPAGDSGGYFQNLPVYNFYPDSASTMRIGDQVLGLGADYLPNSRKEKRVVLDGVPVVYGGTAGDTTTWISGDEMAGKIVVFTVPATGASNPPQTPGLRARLDRAVAIFVITLDRIPANFRPRLLRSQALVSGNSAQPAAPTILVSQRVATLLFGPMDSLRRGAAGTPISGTLILRRTQAPGRNVVGIIPGSDPKLKGQYVAIGAHNDHIGFNNRLVDHDSIRAFNMIARVQGADSPAPGKLTDEQSARLRTMIDSLRRLHPARLDSIYNGADDDGSGSMSVLEIAEYFATAKTKPKRSLLFVWHAGEEKGLWGSEYYTDHPTVPRDSIVAQLNMDMVGRGAATDVTGETKTGELTRGGPGYLQLVGSRRLSTELGDLMESVNEKNRLGFNFDYSMDANGHPQNIYCRSDHYEYARYGIPIVFMTTGGHSDYHQVTDEPQYIDYPHMAAVAGLVKDVAIAVANLDHRIGVDRPKPDPKGRCVQ